MVIKNKPIVPFAETSERNRAAALSKGCRENKKKLSKHHSLVMPTESASDTTKEYKLPNKSTSQRRSIFKFSIAQWNARSTNTQEKLDFIKTFNSNITTLQEIWSKGHIIAENFEKLNIEKRMYQNGGGTATILDKFAPFNIQKKIRINKDTTLIRINFSNHYLWLGNIYLCKGNIRKIQKLFGEIQENIPYNEISQLLMIGDFNINLLDEDNDTYIFLKESCKYLGLRIENPDRDTRNGATLDYIVCGKSIIIKDKKVLLNDCSDHSAIRWEIEVNLPSKIKQIKIPSRKTAEEITSNLLTNEEVINSAAFLDELYLYRKSNHQRMKQLVTYKQRDFQLFNKLLALDDPSTVKETINEHWRQHWKTTENKRWSIESKLAYQDLKSNLKYHLYEKRDGGIINQVITDEGTLVNNPKEVNEQLAKTIEEIQVSDKWDYLMDKTFPRLPNLSTDQMKSLLERLSSGKAITLDGVTDSIFKQENKDKAASIFRDLWSTDLMNIKGIKASFTSRLVPLNKVFPNVATRKQMRPILVCSPLQKLLEARFLPKLTEYLQNKLARSQVGFVPGMGIQVNLLRAICVSKMSTEENNRSRYGLFIDFANAYNTVPHTFLFQKLRQKKCMDEEEIEYLEALYSQYRIQIGDKKIRYNRGVAQGSILSPALFDIYIEDLAEEISLKTELSFEDILFYADDILILCQSPTQIKKCIEIIEKWSELNGMELNKKKSAILPLSSRMAKDIPFMKLEKCIDSVTQKVTHQEWTPALNEINGIPVVNKYKYLGTYLDSKLTMRTQVESIKKKSNFLFVKLYPYLKNATADGRRDIWKTMVVPLFNAVFMLAMFDKSESEVKKINTELLGTFKRYLMIPKTTNSDIVWEMIGDDFDEITKRLKNNAAEKWFARREYREPILTEKKKSVNYLKGIPNTWCEILKQQCRVCHKCKNSTKNIVHMREAHQTEIISFKEIWENIKEYHKNELEKHEKKKTIMKIKRTVFLEFWKPILKNIKEETDEKYERIYRIKLHNIENKEPKT